jgi:hypothetical protein
MTGSLSEAPAGGGPVLTGGWGRGLTGYEAQLTVCSSLLCKCVGVPPRTTSLPPCMLCAVMGSCVCFVCVLCASTWPLAVGSGW